MRLWLMLLAYAALIAPAAAQGGSTTKCANDPRYLGCYAPSTDFGRTNVVVLAQGDQLRTASVAAILARLIPADVVTALGFMPYSAANPAGYISAAGAPVQSVAGRTGAVTISVGDISGLAGTYAPLASPNFTGTVSIGGAGALNGVAVRLGVGGTKAILSADGGGTLTVDAPNTVVLYTMLFGAGATRASIAADGGGSLTVTAPNITLSGPTYVPTPTAGDVSTRAASTAFVAGAARVPVVASSCASSQALAYPASGSAAYDITLTGSCTLSLTGGTSGQLQTITLVLRQDATGGRAVTLPAGVKWVGGTAPTPGTAAGGIDYYTFATPDARTTVIGGYRP